eukprot:GHVR01018343.1.p1 GENE.GHVR01018343.1~~GHVR01018343.1.p1  ORF type:complete len:125 (-),score=2.15 GHVR01018343.1:85-459(-)
MFVFADTGMCLNIVTLLFCLTRRSLFGLDGMPCEVLWRPVIADRLSLQRLRVDLPVTRPVWDSNLGPPASNNSYSINSSSNSCSINSSNNSYYINSSSNSYSINSSNNIYSITSSNNSYSINNI